MHARAPIFAWCDCHCLAYSRTAPKRNVVNTKTATSNKICLNIYISLDYTPNHMHLVKQLPFLPRILFAEFCCVFLCFFNLVLMLLHSTKHEFLHYVAPHKSAECMQDSIISFLFSCGKRNIKCNEVYGIIAKW